MTNPSLLNHLRSLFRYRELLWMWTLREIKVRYKQSLLGIAWAILQPLSLMVIFSVVFSIFVPLPTDGVPYPIFSYTALLPWTFFTTAITFGVPSLTNNMHLVTKIYFPREILPMAVIGAALVDLGAAATVFLGMLLFYRVQIGVAFLLAPVLLLIEIALALGVVFFASAVNARFRDVRFVVPLAMQLWMYATPIIYPMSLVPERFRLLYQLNPMAVLIEAYRSVILHRQMPTGGMLALVAGLSFTVLVLGYWYFKTEERTFADII